jgi:hypothetical protein
MDEIIFKSNSTRDRLILELQGRCGHRIREVLNLTMKVYHYGLLRIHTCFQLLCKSQDFISRY